MSISRESSNTPQLFKEKTLQNVQDDLKRKIKTIVNIIKLVL